MKALVFDRFGDPADVLHLRDVPLPEPGRGQVRVRMTHSPINPSDLMTVRGIYGKKPQLPAVPGFEGVGRVDATGPGLLKHVRGLRPGRRVAVLNRNGGNWQEAVVVPAEQLVPVPDDLPDEQAATFFVNPASVYVMVHEILRVPPGAWLLQTAAGSTLGRMVIRLGRHAGFRTLNVVRRREQAEELVRAGGDAMVCTADESVEDKARELTGGEGVRYALDAVGGATGSAAVRALGPGGRLLVYGTLSEEPLSFDPRTIMVGAKRVEGFWLSEWVRTRNKLQMLRLFRRLTALLRAGVLTSDLGRTFPMERAAEAVREAVAPGRSGKVLLRLGG
jgi:NADPH:quinone reductase